MGLLDRFRRNLPSQAPNGQPVRYQTFPASAAVDVLGLSVEELWRTQPYLRTVVTFLARNIAQLGVHSFVRASDTDRLRVTDTPLPLLLRRPNQRTTTYELVFSLVADLALYDEAMWLVQPSDQASGWSLTPIPPSWVTARGGGTAFGVDWYDLLPPGGVKAVRVKAEDMLVFRGWNPDDLAHGSSPVSALKQILAEQIHAQSYRQQVWERGGRVGAVLTRPAGTPWSPEAKERFQTDWKDKWTGDDGPRAGGTPILEDGMTLQRVGFSAHDEEFVAAAKLSLSMVASAYHVNPTMVGVLDNANYSNVREFRRMLYGDTLGPTIAMIEDRINTFLAPKIEPGAGVYVEFNIAEKLQGSFEEQAAVMQTLVGAPIMSRDEGRARFNLSAMGGEAEELVTPLNVLIGGQASPRDSGTQNEGPKSRGVKFKARAPETHEEKWAQTLAKFFRRQGAAVQSAIGAGSDWWDAERWDKELSDDLFKLALMTSEVIGKTAAESLGFEPDSYDPDMTLHFLQAVAERQAGGINATTKAQVEDALTEDEPAEAVKHTFEVAQESRAKQEATSAVTFASAFAVVEAGKQVGAKTKTWVSSHLADSRHSRYDGETVPIGDDFSIGAPWPGDASLPVSQTANCQCSVTINPA